MYRNQFNKTLKDMKTSSFTFKFTRLLLILFLFTNYLHAQSESTSDVVSDEDTMLVDSLPPFSPAFGLGIAGGLWALPAVDFSYQVNSWLGLSLGYNRFDFKIKDKEISTSDYGFGEEKMLINGRFHLQNVQLSAHLSAPKLKWLRLQLGAAINLKEDSYANFAFAESLFLNDLEIKPENVGAIEGRLEESSTLIPYIGLGIGRLVPKKRIAFNLNGGVFYRGAPDFTITGTKMLKGNEHNAEVLEENFKTFKWLPAFNFRLAIRLK
ncbi:MAG: hypothetical protein ACI85O_000387 [Saprospiraceae bacterium]